MTATAEHSAPPGLSWDVRQIGIVAVGRNEGDRLRRCLDAAAQHTSRVVYVDSGSSDGSPKIAAARDIDIVYLSNDRPYTAARARNAGLAHLLKSYPNLALVQFVDADCELAPDWLPAAMQRLQDDVTLAAVCGRRHETNREATVYNRLTDLEWDRSAGITDAFAGDALCRVEALRQVGGFSDGLICGEEPELCLRFRRRGWRIERLPRSMSWHDAAMHRFGQWWRRRLRGGWAYAEGAAVHSRPGERHNVRQSLSTWVWGGLMPATIILTLWPTGGWSLLFAIVYPAQGMRIYRRERIRGRAPRDASTWALFCVIGKFPEMMGQLRYWWHRALGRRGRLIEYKGPASGGVA